MQLNELKDGFLQWVEATTENPFPENEYLRACLDDQAAFVMKVTFAGIPATEHYGIPKLYSYLFAKVQKYANLLMDTDSHEGHLMMNKRDVDVPFTEEEKEEMKALLEELSGALS